MNKSGKKRTASISWEIFEKKGFKNVAEAE